MAISIKFKDVSFCVYDHDQGALYVETQNDKIRLEDEDFVGLLAFLNVANSANKVKRKPPEILPTKPENLIQTPF